MVIQVLQMKDVFLIISATWASNELLSYVLEFILVSAKNKNLCRFFSPPQERKIIFLAILFFYSLFFFHTSGLPLSSVGNVITYLNSIQSDILSFILNVILWECVNMYIVRCLIPIIIAFTLLNSDVIQDRKMHFRITSAAWEVLVLLFHGMTVMFQQSIHIDLGW